MLCGFLLFSLWMFQFLLPASVRNKDRVLNIEIFTSQCFQVVFRQYSPLYRKQVKTELGRSLKWLRAMLQDNTQQYLLAQSQRYLKKVWNMFKINNKDTWTTSLPSFWCLHDQGLKNWKFGCTFLRVHQYRFAYTSCTQPISHMWITCACTRVRRSCMPPCTWLCTLHK